MGYGMQISMFVRKKAKEEELGNSKFYVRHMLWQISINTFISAKMKKVLIIKKMLL